MDRNVVIATALITAIMFVWLFWLTPPPPQPAPDGTLPDSQAVTQVTPTPDTPEQPTVAPAVVDSALVGAQQGEAREVVVENDLYRATFSTKGATLTSFVLKEYTQFDQTTPVQLVETTETGALALLFTTPQNHNVDTRSLYFEPSIDGDVLNVAQGDTTQLAFRAQLGAGILELTYLFVPDSYEVGLLINQENAATFSTRDGYDIIWDGGIPYTEDNPEDEAMRAGAFARSGGEVESVVLASDSYGERALAGQVDWVAVKNKYFTSVLIPSGATRGGELLGERLVEGDAASEQHYEVRLEMPPVPAGEVDRFRLYVGPMEFYRITDYKLGLYDMVDYGYDFLEWMVRPLAKYVFIPVFTFLSTFIPNYGLIIILFAFLVKMALYPLTKSSYKSMARMRELQPKMQAIKEQYADDPQKQQEAMMRMYKETGVNPLGGCLPMLFQWPVIIALWQFFPQSIEIRQQSFLWANDLSAPDIILNLPFTIPLYGNYVAGFTLLMGLSMIVQMRIQMNPSTQNAQTKVLTYVMPLVLFFFFNRLASGLSLYYLCYNVFTAIQQKFINKSLHAETEAAEADGSNGKASAKKAKARTNGQRKRPDGPRSKKGRKVRT